MGRDAWGCAGDAVLIGNGSAYNEVGQRSANCLTRDQLTRTELMTKMVDRTGQRYGRLLVLQREESTPAGESRWLCKCDCGKHRIVSGASLRRGTASCGCLRAEGLSERRKLNLAGRRMGELHVIRRMGKNNHGSYLWLCRCDCGNYKQIAAANLTSGTRSCGCATGRAAARGLKDMVGLRFGRLVAIRRVEGRPNRPARWLFQCDCGKQVNAQGSTVRNGGVRSCGCLKIEKNREWGKKIGPLHLKNEGIAAYESDPDYASRLSHVYLVRVATWYLKIGIAFDILLRGRGDYEEIVFSRQLTRAQCWAVEQKALRLTDRWSTMTVPRDLKCKGFSEFRENMPEQIAIQLLTELCDRAEAEGWRALISET